MQSITLLLALEWDTFLNELPMNRYRVVFEKVTSEQSTQEQLQVLKKIRLSCRPERSNRDVRTPGQQTPQPSRRCIQ